MPRHSTCHDFSVSLTPGQIQRLPAAAHGIFEGHSLVAPAVSLEEGDARDPPPARPSVASGTNDSTGATPDLLDSSKNSTNADSTPPVELEGDHLGDPTAFDAASGCSRLLKAAAASAATSRPHRATPTMRPVNHAVQIVHFLSARASVAPANHSSNSAFASPASHQLHFLHSDASPPDETHEGDFLENSARPANSTHSSAASAAAGSSGTCQFFVTPAPASDSHKLSQLLPAHAASLVAWQPA